MENVILVLGAVVWNKCLSIFKLWKVDMAWFFKCVSFLGLFLNKKSSINFTYINKKLLIYSKRETKDLNFWIVTCLKSVEF